MNKVQNATEQSVILENVSDASLTPREIVAELDRYIIAQDDAKKAVAVAMRNRWRRLRVEGEMRDEITPKNIIMIGPTGVGKTEIARRLGKLARAPFIKVEASKFTEVGYVGRDVESIIRDLAEVSINMVRAEEARAVKERADGIVEEQLLNLLLPDSSVNKGDVEKRMAETFDLSDAGTVTGTVILDAFQLSSPKEDVFKVEVSEVDESSAREKLRQMLRDGKLDDRLVEIETTKQVGAHLEIFGPPGMSDVEGQIKEVFSNFMPKTKERKKLSVKDARKSLIAEAQDNLIDHDHVTQRALRRVEEAGIVFIDEIDKICGRDASSKGPDVSREGVQRDLLPLVEGCTVATKYGQIKTDHVLFIASGAFHVTKPSDLMPEFQGRFPIRVELKSLTATDFVRILTEPQNALTRQYIALLKTEGVELEFTDEAISEIASLTADVNSRTENIGARRLHTLLEKLLEELSFSADEVHSDKVVIDREYVRERLSDIVADQDLSRFIL